MKRPVRLLVERTAANDPALIEVDCDDMDMDAAEAVELVAALKSNTHVIKLNFNRRYIGVGGTTALLGVALAKSSTSLLEINSSILEINLWGNAIGVGGATALGEALTRNSSLAKLNLGDNRIGDGGARALAEALTRNSSLAELSLWGNGISDSGARALAEALQRNSSLAKLFLQCNVIRVDGARSIAEALPRNWSVRELYLVGNKFSDAVLEEGIGKILERNKCEIKLMQACSAMQLMTSSFPFLLSSAGRLCGLRTVYGLFRKHPDMLLHSEYRQPTKRVRL